MGRKGRGGTRGKRKGASTGLLWGAGLVALVAALVLPTLGSATHHPEPREHVDHTHVADADRYGAYPRVARIYRVVAEIPNVIDGIYCYCECSNHSGHYSLLDCYKDDHAARCDVCLSEAAMAYRMHQDGASLDEIRTAIDRLYET